MRSRGGIPGETPWKGSAHETESARRFRQPYHVPDPAICRGCNRREYPVAPCVRAGLRTWAGIIAGVALLVIGVPAWLSSVVHVLVHVPQKRLITTGPFAVVPHPMYTSVSLLVLPGTRPAVRTPGPESPSARCLRLLAALLPERRTGSWRRRSRRSTPPGGSAVLSRGCGTRAAAADSFAASTPSLRSPS